VGSNSSFVETEAEYNVLSTSNFEIDSFSIYPNPFKSHLNILSKKRIINLKLYNSQGKLLINSNKIVFSLLKAGIYFLIIKNEKNVISVKKIIKE